MKRILFLFLPFLPYLATAQVAKDTVTVLTLAQIPAGVIRDTTNLTFVQDNAFNKARFDSLARYVTSKLIGDRGDVDVSGATGLNWTLDTNSVVTVDIVDSAVTARKLGTASVGLASSTVTGTLQVGNGGTGTETQFTAGSVVFAGASGVYSQNNSGLFWDNTNRRLIVGSTTAGANLNVYTSSYGNNGLINAYNANNVIKLQMGALADDVGYIYTPTSTRLDLFSGNARTMTLSSDQNVGIGTNSPSQKLHVVGNARITAMNSINDIGADANGVLQAATSDYNLKNSIQDSDFGLNHILRLKPVTFLYNDQDRKIHSEIPEIGFIAQDVNDVIPNAVSPTGEGTLQLDYRAITATLTKAIQEQQAQIEALKARITQLENK